MADVRGFSPPPVGDPNADVLSAAVKGRISGAMLTDEEIQLLRLVQYPELLHRQIGALARDHGVPHGCYAMHGCAAALVEFSGERRGTLPDSSSSVTASRESSSLAQDDIAPLAGPARYVPTPEDRSAAISGDGDGNAPRGGGPAVARRSAWEVLLAVLRLLVAGSARC